MSRLSIEVTPEFHHAIKEMAFEQGVSLRDFVLERFADANKYTVSHEQNSGAGHDDCPICRSYGKNREYNAKTLKSLDDAKNKKGMKSYKNVDEMFSDLGIR